MTSDKYTTFFEDSQIFREAPPFWKFILYFNLPYKTIVKHAIAPQLAFEVSNDNEDEKTPLSKLFELFEKDDPLMNPDINAHHSRISDRSKKDQPSDKSRCPNIILMKVDMTE